MFMWTATPTPGPRGPAHAFVMRSDYIIGTNFWLRVRFGPLSPTPLRDSR